MKSFLLVASLAVFVLFSSKSSQKNIVSAENIQKNQFKKLMFMRIIVILDLNYQP